jgi:murein L,D-transpeptidase YcbB/YkuD
MRKFLLATTAAALALTWSGHAVAAPDKAPAASSIAPAEATTPGGLMFSKDATQAKPIDKPIEQATPAEQERHPEMTKPLEQAAPGAASTESTPSAASQPARDAASAQLKDLIETRLSQYVPREQDRTGVLAFYRERNFAPLWIESGKMGPRAEQAAAFLKGVAADGLDPADYPIPSFADPEKFAADELALSNAVITFARHASIGRVAFTRVSGAVYFDQKAPGAADVLGKLASATDVRATLDGYNPQTPQYKALKAQLAAVRSGKTSEPKAASPEPKSAAQDGKAKSKKKKKEAGTGNKNKEKKDDARPKSASVDTIIANMERWRWMPHELAPVHVMVNIPDYTLKVVQNGKTVWSTKIVVGKVGNHATPLLTETMKYITVNPTWNVPPSIIRNEYLPALARDPNALSRVGLQVGRNKDGSIRIFQPPGEKNALGRIRFNFPNRFLVYQHDTPDKKLFSMATRAYSHGCMRVQNPDEYAEVLLGLTQPEDKYTAERIRAMYGKNERNITLKKPIPVYVTYQTAFVDDAGKPQARADVYALDSRVLDELRGDRRNADVPIARNYNSGSKPVMSSAAAASNARASGYPSSPGYTTWSGSDSAWNMRSAYQPSDRHRVR